MNDFSRAYDEWHARYEPDAGADTPWHNLVRHHLNLNRDLLDKKILEVACGRGGFACWLAQHSSKPKAVVAADFSRQAIEKARGMSGLLKLSNVVWNVADIQRLPYPSETFDTVFSCETIEHVPEPRQALSELARVLKPGGRLFLTSPNYFGLWGLYRGYLHVRQRPYREEGQPINQFLLLPITRRWIRHTGLTIDRTDGVGHYFLFPGRNPRALAILDSPRFIMRWIALHSLVIAEKAA